MPIRQTFSGAEVYCNQCGTSVATPDPFTRDPAVHEIIRWRTFRPRPGQTREGYYPQCRTCEAQAAAARRQRGPRVPRTTAAQDRARRGLGIARKFGVEIEMISGPGGRAAIETALLPFTGWRVKYDGSLSAGGVEVTSPPLTGEAGIDEIKTVTRVLRNLGCTVNRTCGLHVHHDIRDLQIAEAKRLARAWALHQNTIDGLVSPSRRNGGSHYCGRLTQSDLRQIDNARDLRSLSLTRYRTLNLMSYGRFGTVEVRQHQGTIDGEKITSWIRFGQAMIDSAIEAPAAIEERVSSLRQLWDRLGSRFDETARTFLTGRAVEFGAVTV